MAGIIKGLKELADMAGLDTKATKYLQRLAQRAKEAKTIKGKTLAQSKLEQKTGEAVGKAGYRHAVSQVPDPRIPRPRAKGGGIYKKKKPKPKHKKDDFELPKKHRTPRGGYGKYVTGRTHGGKIDNSGQYLVAKQYGGKVK